MKVLMRIIDNLACVLLIIALISLNSCMSTTPMFDSYIDFNYPHLSKIKVSNSKTLKGVNLTFKEYFKDFDGVDTNLIVIHESYTVDLKNNYSKIFFIKDYKLDKSFRFKNKDQNPESIDSLTALEIKSYGIYYFDFMSTFIKENGMENIHKILDTENCGVLTGANSARITLFNKNLKAVDSYFFNQGLWCVDREFQKNMIEKFLEKN